MVSNYENPFPKRGGEAMNVGEFCKKLDQMVNFGWVEVFKLLMTIERAGLSHTL